MSQQAKVERLLRSFSDNRRLMSKQFNIDSSITKAQYEILSLVDSGQHRVVDMAAEFQTSTSAVTQLVQQLVESGHLVRQTSTTDRREVVLSLTASGKEALDQIHATLRHWAAGIASALSDEELEQYISINDKIANYIKQKGAK